MKEKKWFSQTHSIAMLSIIGFLILILIFSNIDIKINETATVNEVEYEYVSQVLKNNSKERIDKIVVNEEISSEEMEKIYNERKQENQDYEKFTIWFFSSKDNAINSDNYELGYVSTENDNITIKNIKEEQQKKNEEERIKQEEQQKAEEIKKQEEEEKKTEEQKEKEFKEGCKTYSFEELARNPDKVEGEKVKLTGEVIQVMKGEFVKAYRVNITKNEYDFYEDTIYLTYVPKAENEDNILEDDIITIWGTASGDYTYTSVMGVSVTVPHVDAEYIEIN